MLKTVLFLCLLAPAFSHSGEKADKASDKAPTISKVTLSKNEKFFNDFFKGLERLDMNTSMLFKISSKFTSLDLSGFGEDSDLLGGFGVGAFGALKLFKLNPNVGDGKDHFNDKGDLNSIDLINPSIARVVIHEFFHAYRALYMDDDDLQARKNTALFEKIAKEIREDGLDKAVEEEGYLGKLSHIGNFRFTDEGLKNKFAADYTDEAIAHFFGAAIQGVLAIERIINEHNFKKGMSGEELAFLLKKKRSELSMSDLENPVLERFTLPPYQQMALQFHKFSKGVFLPFGGNSDIDKNSRDYDFHFASHFEAYDEPYFYSGFKNWSSVRPKSGPIAIRKENASPMLKNFMELNMPSTLREVFTRMNGSEGYAKIRKQLKKFRQDFLKIYLKSKNDLNKDETPFLDMEGLQMGGGE